MAYSNCKSADCDIYGVELATRREVVVSEQGWDEDQPSTDGVRVVWRDARNVDRAYRNGNNQLVNFDLYGTVLGDGKPATMSKAAQMQNRPGVWGNTVVWADFRDSVGADDPDAGNIYMTDFPSGKETVVVKAKSAQVRPATNGRYIVWVDYRNEPDPNGTNSDIYAYDLATGQEFPITTAPDTQTDPAISGNIVVWADWRKGDNTADIYGYDLAAKREFPISTAPGSQIQPAISGNIVVWADFRNEKDPAGSNTDIYGFDLATKQEFPIFVGPAPQRQPEVTEGVVAWEDEAKGNKNIDIMGATISGIAIAPPPSPSPALPGTGAHRFPETHQVITGLFLDYWEKHGGLPQQGYPISDVMREKSDLDGKEYTVQYFERAVMEYHPEQKPPFNVLLSQLGTFRYQQKYPHAAPNQSTNNSPGARFFPETGKTIGGLFFIYWNNHGGLAQQGYPISDEFKERSDLDGKEYTVQYFERAVFELHPENPEPYSVLLSQLGTFRYQQKYGGR
jgi:beta propeller repeat protein